MKTNTYRAKKLLLSLFTMLLPLLASGTTVTIGRITYNVIEKVGNAEVTKVNMDNTNSIEIPSSIVYDGVEYTVTSIAGYVFSQDLLSITIPPTITKIGESAFSSSYRLNSVYITDLAAWCNIEFENAYANPLASAKKFYINNKQTKSIEIPNSVKTIKKYAFSSFEELTSVTIPIGVTEIERHAFEYCYNLYKVTLPEGVLNIGDNAFCGCNTLSNIVLPEGIKTIGDNVFASCSSLKSITIPEGVTSIGDYAFEYCRSLQNVIIPEGVTSIESKTFYNCSTLKSIVLPKSLKSIAYNAFASCPDLADVYCSAESVPNTSTSAFTDSYPEYATLHVPASAISSYETTAPWSSFGTIVTIEEVTLEKCSTPPISYVDGKVMFACDTEGAKIKSSVKEDIEGDYNDMEFDLIPTYTITAYATKEQYEDSDIATLTLCWVPCEEHEEEDDESTGILTIPSKPVLISARDGVLTLNGLAEGTEVAVVTTGGTAVATATATNGTATLATDLEAGTIAIVKIGNYSIKVAIK